MIKKIMILFLAIWIAAAPVLAEEMPPMPKAPLFLTSTKPRHLDPEYWIAKIPTAEKILLNPAELAELNRNIEDSIPARKDLFRQGNSMAGHHVEDQIRLEFTTMKGRRLWDKFGNDVKPEVFEKIEPLCAMDKIPKAVKFRWGAATRYTSVRALPTDMKMLEAPDDIEFDQLQYSAIKLWTPVIILHESKDGQWYYVQAPYTRGWAKAADIAVFSSREKLKEFVGSRNFLTVIGERVWIYGDTALTERLQYTTMGTYLPLAASGQGLYTIWYPVRGKGGAVSIRKAYAARRGDVRQGYLPYSQANVIRQAFKLLGARYGWGGMYGGRDCSGFIHDVFLSFGIAMPRNSKEQCLIGTQINHFDRNEDPAVKAAWIRQGQPGITMLKTKGHQMLYIGEENKQLYIIHSTWAERYSMDSDAKNRINQVVVTDVTLNGRSRVGSLIENTLAVNEVF